MRKMEETPANILRQARADALRYAEGCDQQADYHECEGKRLREAATQSRYLHCRLGASIQVLEGDRAPLDLPAEQEPKSADAAA